MAQTQVSRRSGNHVFAKISNDNGKTWSKFMIDWKTVSRNDFIQRYKASA